ncbi:hypothetical protein [Thermohalobacter berrensis]|uniref:hypothetical protein n=1 Tax=Thermohalobacter berrensis TaxID=99594 RepID=UPI0015FF4129|nr:hypothetical protein [Thermohalobacter berrensis]
MDRRPMPPIEKVEREVAVGEPAEEQGFFFGGFWWIFIFCICFFFIFGGFGFKKY